MAINNTSIQKLINLHCEKRAREKEKGDGSCRVNHGHKLGHWRGTKTHSPLIVNCKREIPCDKPSHDNTFHFFHILN